MAEFERTVERNLFEVDNARNLSPREIVETFIPKKSFWRLFSEKHHIIYGARGSGKTVIVKMLSHDHLSQFRNVEAEHIINSRKFIGIYVPTKLDWVGGLKNKPWQSEKEKEEFFQWRLNMATCLSFTKTIKSCLNTYIKNDGDRARIERRLVGEIMNSWGVGNSTHENITLQALQYGLQDIDYKKQQHLAATRASKRIIPEEEGLGIAFDMELFAPLKRAITLTERILEFPDDTIWMLCLDEAEFLDRDHHRILNSHLRAHSGNLVFKITTMPYFHRTTETNVGVPLNVGDDFEYVYLDKDPVQLEASNATLDDEEKRRVEFATKLFEKRAQISGGIYKHTDLLELLGFSLLLDHKKESDWTEKSKNMMLLRKYCNKKTVERAERLVHTPKKFKDEIARKIHGALILRNAVESQKGKKKRLEVYSGFTMAVRCSDSNPRRLIRIFNRFILHSKQSKDKKSFKPLEPKSQTNLLKGFSSITLNRVFSEPEVGPDLMEFLTTIGDFMKDRFYKEQLTTNPVYSIKVDRNASKQEWELIKHAVGIGLLFPNVSMNNPDQIPEVEGIFRLAYVLAPHFNLLPRRGECRSLSSITLKWRTEQKQFEISE